MAKLEFDALMMEIVTMVVWNLIGLFVLSSHASLPSNQIKAAIQHALHVRNESAIGSRALSRAIYLGDDSRLRNALHKAYSGQPMKISIIGGSISFGLGAGRLGDQALIYADRLREWAKEAWPASNVTVFNGALSFPAVSTARNASEPACCSRFFKRKTPPIGDEQLYVVLLNTLRTYGQRHNHSGAGIQRFSFLSGMGHARCDEEQERL